MDGRFFLLTEVCHQPGYEWATVRWLRNQIYAKRLVSHKVGGRVLVNLDDLDAKLTAGRREAYGA